MQMNANSPELATFKRLVIDLNAEWKMFEKLFLNDGNYILFNQTGRMFWFDIQNCLINTILQSISRFFDPAHNPHQQNLSLQTVISLAEVASIRKDLKRRLKEMRPVWEKGIKVWRNKKLSHSDLLTSLGKTTLPDIPFSQVKHLVSGITEIARQIDLQLNNVDMSYEVSTGEWVPKVLGYLRAGVQKRKEDGLP